ncbi:MAG: hypothetical protein QM582_01620 [Micropruina sp.]|uniref:hypothetical protein n=1 Tax=Micropruina sp. TaxID=2737536 RepID=UPI0039E5316F
MTNQRPRLARIIAAGTALLLTAGCSVSVGSDAPSAPAAPSAPGSPAATAFEPAPGTTQPQPSEDAVPAGAKPVDGLVAAATREAKRTTATIKGDSSGTRYDSALSLWAGCDGGVDEVVFGVAGHQIFQGKLGLRTSVPDDIVIQVLILADGEAVQNVQLDGTNPTPALLPVRFLIKGKKTVTTRTKVVQGTCSSSDDSYAVLVDGYVH